MLLEQSRGARRGPNDGSRPGTGGQRGDGGDRPITTNSNSQRGSPSRFPMSQVPSDRGSAYPMPSGLSSGLPSFTSEGFTDRLTSQIPPTPNRSPRPSPQFGSSPRPAPQFDSSPRPSPQFDSSPRPTPQFDSSPRPTPPSGSSIRPSPPSGSRPGGLPIPLLFQLLHNLQHIADRYLLANPYLVVESDKFKPAHSFP